MENTNTTFDLLECVKSAGVVGAGGAGFPTHVKLKAQAEIVIVNGAECEPLLRVDQQLMATRTKELLDALSTVVEFVGAKQGIVALKEHYHAAVASLKKELPAYPKLSLFELDNFYPAGDEQVTVYEVTKRIVPEGGIPLNVGVIVSNVETLLQIDEYIKSGLPVCDKYVTVTGEVKNPLTVRVPLGITVKQCIELAGGATVEDYVVVNGGPMMGKIVAADSLVTKTTKGLIVLPRDHSLIITLEKDIAGMLRQARTACMHCSLCTEVCPRNLIGHRIEPNKLIRIASYGSTCAPDDVLSTAFLCCGCRLCEYACVMDLQPWKLHGLLKTQLGKQGIKNPHHNVPEHAHPFREYKKFPIKKLIAKLGLTQYDLPAPLTELNVKFDKVTLATNQHIGAPAVPVVAVGDVVKKGDVVAAAQEGKLGANICASIDGTVTAVSDKAVTIG